MDVQGEKIKLIEWLVGLTDVSVLQKVSKIRSESSGHVLHHVDDQKLKERALMSESEIKNGKYISLDTLKEEMKAW